MPTFCVHASGDIRHVLEYKPACQSNVADYFKLDSVCGFLVGFLNYYFTWSIQKTLDAPVTVHN